MVRRNFKMRVNEFFTSIIRNLTVGLFLLGLGSIIFSRSLAPELLGYAISMVVSAIVLFFLDLFYIFWTELVANDDGT